MAKEQKKRGANCKPEDKKLKHKYFLSFNNEQNIVLIDQAQEAFGMPFVRRFIKNVILKSIGMLPDTKKKISCRPEKTNGTYFVSFTDGQHAKLQEQSKKMLGIVDVHTYLKANILKQIN